MHVCLVTLDFPPFRGSGLTIYAEKVVKGLVACGHRVTVLAAQRPESERAEAPDLPPEVRVLRFDVGRADWIALGWQAARFLRGCSHEFDVVHFADVHFAYAYRQPYLATGHQSFRQRLSSHGGRTYHGNRRNLVFRTLYYSTAYRAMERPAVRRAHHMVMVSQTTQQEFVAEYGLSPRRTTVVYTGIDLDRFEGAPGQAVARATLGLIDDLPVLLYIGFSTPRKGVEYLAQALGRMQSPAQLVMVGKWEKGYRERFLAALGAQRERVRITGYVPDAGLLDYYAAADIFVLPSLLEGFGIPLVEAMAAGVPVLTTSGSAAEEIAGEAGLIVPRADDLALAQALDRLLAQPELRKRMSEAGRERARSLFDQRRMTAHMDALYHRVLAELR
ncbi:MAG: glycosyltransferase family 4 protein [Anaerolineae bacterium]|nr:glycosyltransferase family 4 protein [Anaerolineae bacterium]